MAASLLVAACDASDPDASDPEVELPPDDRDLEAIQAWLVAGHYQQWERLDPVPSAEMPGVGRVYLSPALADSLRNERSSHPIGAAAVREIFDATDPDTQLGWAYLRKLDEAAEPNSWLFYEVFELSAEAVPLVAERAAPGCVPCHGEGTDMIRSQLP